MSGRCAGVAADPLRVFMFVGRDDDVSSQLAPMARRCRAGRERQLRALPRRARLAALARPPRPDAGARRTRCQRACRGRDPGPPARWPGRLPIPREPRRPSRAGPPPACPGRRRSTRRAGCCWRCCPPPLINLGFLLQHRGLPAASPGRAARRWPGPAQPHVARRPGAGLDGVRRPDRRGGDRAAVARAGVRRRRAGAVGAARRGPSAIRSPARQLLAILLIGVGLASLPIGLRTPTATSHGRTLVQAWLIALPVAAMLGLAGRGAAPRAIAAGMFYGAADAAIKAVAIEWHPVTRPHSCRGGLLLAAVATFCGFRLLPGGAAPKARR